MCLSFQIMKTADSGLSMNLTLHNYTQTAIARVDNN